MDMATNLNPNPNPNPDGGPTMSGSECRCPLPHDICTWRRRRPYVPLLSLCVICDNVCRAPCAQLPGFQRVLLQSAFFSRLQAIQMICTSSHIRRPQLQRAAIYYPRSSHVAPAAPHLQRRLRAHRGLYLYKCSVALSAAPSSLSRST
jgi:hypothetical protein